MVPGAPEQPHLRETALLISEGPRQPPSLGGEPVLKRGPNALNPVHLWPESPLLPSVLQSSKNCSSESQTGVIGQQFGEGKQRIKDQILFSP